ncbi:hypothetical protein LAZ67_23001537 [Cordylochernes scorpioides]|uniref:RNA-directed DNA polymerase n=1 Tax=Cordylochernes scorpioides TaxID=51811 RepID=A0ABY6LQX9_9ARAC|nr:hypothetical protein LAZ67_23001537 [Cordylochernes scorpioides]
MDKLKKACETKKRTLESVIAEADGELGKQEPSLEMLMSLRPKLLRCKDKFLIASDCLIEQLIKADREDEEIEDVDIVQANLFGRSEGVLQKMEQLLAKPTVDRESIVSGGNEGKSNLHRLPKLELPKFGGEAREWLQFWSAFQSVHDDDSISACVKFQYLQNCMIKGSVSEEIVSSFPNSAANYPLVISTLMERFGREDMLVEVYVRDLIAIILENAHGRNTTSFSTVYVRLSSQLRALGSLGVTTDKCAAILYPMVESALPEDLFVAWERTRHHHKPDEDGKHNSSEALLEKLMEFLKHEVEGSERMRLARQPFSSSYPSQFNRDKPPKPKTSVATAASLVVADGKSNNAYKCVFCDGKHWSEQCCKAMSMSLEARRKIIQEKQCCYSCLKPGHFSKYCRNVVKCVICSKKHRAILCPVSKGSQKSDGIEERSKNINASVYMSNQIRCQDVLLQTIMVKINGENKSKVVRAMLDSGSQNSYVLEQTASEVGLTMLGKKEVVHLLFGGVKSRPQQNKRYRIYISDVDSKYNCNFEVQDCSTICSAMPSAQPTEWMTELRSKGIDLDVYRSNTEIELLLGADVYAKLLTGKKIELESGPVALETKLGWTVSGKVLGNVQTTKSQSSVLSCLVRDATIQDLWRLDVIGIMEPMKEKSKEELSVAALEHFNQTVKQNEDGRYSVNLPWIGGHPPLPNYKLISEKKLESTTARLEKLGVLSTYHDVFKSWEDEGIIERVDSESGHVLSHHGVIKPESQSTPVRPVFNASFRTKGNPSLNDCLEVGPNMLENIPDIITRFRLGPVAVTSDIRKAFLQIEVTEEDRNYLQFWWYKNQKLEEKQMYRHCRVVFGVSSSPFLLAAVIDHHLSTYEDEYKKTIDILRRSMYVDNCVASVGSKEDALKFKEESVEIFGTAKMDLREWEIGPSSEEKQVPVLGLFWNLRTDELTCDLRSFAKKMEPGKVTRRKILSAAHSLFDPIGFTCPFTIIPKMLLQESYGVKAGWDTDLSEDISRRFNAWLSQLTEVDKLKIPRCVVQSQDRRTWTLHVFMDSSNAAFAACAYLRSGFPGSVQVQLLMARSRVAPMKNTTIPRLELVACEIGSRLAVHIKSMMEFEDIPITLWTDSTTALAWIKRDMNWSVFVAGRVKKIRQNSSVIDWRHVPGKENPADIPSLWLKKEEQFWTQSVEKESIEEVNSELRKAVVTHCNIEKGDMLAKITQFSNYHKILRMVAHWRRFLDWLQRKRSNKITKGPITMEEMTLAEERVIRLVQQCSFEGVKDKKFKNLRVYEDESGLLRVKCRFVPVEKVDAHSYPMVMPSNGVTGQLIWSYHRLMCHAGVQSLHANLRERYWILNSRRTIRNEIRPCARCRRFRAQPCYVEEGPLPRDRVRVGPAFDVTGVDMTGPLHLKGNKKYWIAIFTCATYRAIHLELCTSLTTETFIGAMRRFVARRGRPSTIYSDNGLNFVGCKNLFSSLDWNKIVEYGAINRISWKFNPPTACWWGGFWERMIGIVKQLLRSVLGSARVTNEELQTLLCDVEAVVNNRPLTYVSEDDDELAPLTPNKLINNCGSSILPEADEVERDSMVSRYRNMQACREELRARFTKEYLAMLVHHGKARKSRRIEVGEIVLIGNDQKRRIAWPLGKVEEVLPGADGQVRVARVKTSSGVFLRPCYKTSQPVSSAFTIGKLRAAPSNGGEAAAQPIIPPLSTVVKMTNNYIDIKVEGDTIRALVDSGASYSVISERFRVELKKTMFAETDVVLKVADDKVVKSKGRCTLKLEVNGHPENFEFVVLENCSHDVILGWDFFKATNAVIDCGLGELQLYDLPDLDAEGRDDEVYAIQDFVIPGRSSQRISILNRSLVGIVNMEVTCSKELFIRKDVIFPSSLIEFEEGIGKIWITNGGLQPQMIPKGMNLGRMCDIETEHKEVDTMLERKVIQPSESPWSAPVVLVKKKDGTWRFCVDFRRLNHITKKDVYPLPRIDDVLDHLSSARYYSTMDLKTGYWQVEVDERDREKTAFVTPDGLYEFMVMPFGLCNAPATFERMMDNVLMGLKWNICLCYLDDIVVYSDTFEEHLERLSKVLSCLQQAGLTINPDKCLFGSTRIKILGHVVDKDGIQPDSEKVEAIKKFPVPKSVCDIQSYLGLCSYYRRFIKNFSKIAAPLQILLKKDQKFIWTQEQKDSFESLKKALMQKPVLGHFKESAITKLHTDASSYGLGAVLVQIQENQENPIAYASRTLSKAEKNYSTTERECLAVIWAIGKFRPYLYGRPFEVVSDHHSLCWLAGLKDPSGRLARWALKLQDFDATITYKSGVKHKDADCLSRYPLPESPALTSLTLVREQQNLDPDITKISNALNQGEGAERFEMKNGLLYKRNFDPLGRRLLLVIPKCMRPDILKEFHDVPTAGHLGFARTYDRIRKRYFWPGLYNSVRRYVAHCKECQRRKGENKLPAGKLIPIKPSSFPFQKIGMDLLGRFPLSDKGNRWIIVCTDYLTKYAIAKALPSGTAAEIATFILEEVILKHGAPREIITDRGRAFMSQMVKEVTSRCKISHLFTTAYHPQTNGLTERLNKTLGDMLSMYVDAEQRDCDSVLPYVIFAYNMAQQGSTRFSPFFLVHGREAETLLDVLLPYEDETSLGTSGSSGTKFKTEETQPEGRRPCAPDEALQRSWPTAAISSHTCVTPVQSLPMQQGNQRIDPSKIVVLDHVVTTQDRQQFITLKYIGDDGIEQEILVPFINPEEHQGATSESIHVTLSMPHEIFKIHLRPDGVPRVPAGVLTFTHWKTHSVKTWSFNWRRCQVRFWKKPDKITLNGLPFVIEDSDVIKALRPFCQVTSIAPVILTDGKCKWQNTCRDAFMLMHNGMKTTQLPAKINILTEGITTPIYI